MQNVRFNIKSWQAFICEKNYDVKSDKHALFKFISMQTLQF